ncbi:F0F1 ATP synthase subunit A [Ulvibacter litoralis]|uniref:ATP synthase subunit a n=1 Tax=Ulvibacter litoralis TaxID=227084 RepID=A0A1G7D8V3_9FLAO|nr:F0F1 ATP synthase subunit A [Ulvibacter litoralis]SDE47195.1 F-type H+-transporting ATPase subunit a [Ulvibacter litoralis]
MQKKTLTRLLSVFLFVVSFNMTAEVTTEGEGSKDLKTEIKEYISHHLLDSYDFNLYSHDDENGEHQYIGFPLPVIIYDDGLKVFSSSKLKHDKGVAEVDGNYYKSYHGKLYKTNAAGELTYDEDHHPEGRIHADFSITKNVFTILVVSLLIFLMFSNMAKHYKKGPMPKGFGRALEPIILYIRNDIAIPNIGEKKYKRYMPYLLTVFFFVWIINLLGLTPLGINVTNNIAVTLGLALITYLLTTFTANKNYWKHVFWMPGVPWPMKIILAPIELLGTIIKPFSLMIRLYANITAGHIVLMSIIGLMFIFENWLGSSLSFLLAFALSLLELLVAALQAYIFTMLSALYFGAAVEEHHDAH